MDIKEFDYIYDCIDLSGQLFYYYKDKYAVDLLRFFIGGDMSVSTLKKSPFGFLLEKPVMKEILKELPENKLTTNQLDLYWPAESLAFKLSIGEWGGTWYRRNRNYDQISRSGSNLVLRLDFSNMHDKMYYELIRPIDKRRRIFESSSHPVNDKAKTLAWARMDIDLDNGEVLIEEIQNDWLRYADNLYREVSTKCVKGKTERYDNWFFSGTKATYTGLDIYQNEVLNPYRQIWDEAILTAAIWFIRQELGIRRIFYNSWETGNIMKNIRPDWCPPRSLYTKLPRRFGFKATPQEPKMLSEAVKKMRKSNDEYEWFLLEI